MTGNGDSAQGSGHAGHAHQAAIDLRRFEPHERVPLLEMSLSVLEPEERLQATFESWPTVLVHYLERAYCDRFDWWFVGEGENWCLLEIRRLPDDGTRH